MWDPTTSFATAIGPLGEAHSGIRILALRTCKADVVVGLPPGKDEELTTRKAEVEGTKQQNGAENRDENQCRTQKKREWAWSGKWAVVQFHDGKASEEEEVVI